LNQVVANLISNAADAVNLGGTIRVKLSCVEKPSGQFVRISIEDDGPGIPADVKDRIFEPFFTTKIDVGSGLGLWVAKEIVDRHNGDIQVQTRNTNGSSGTIFSVYLPLPVSERNGSPPKDDVVER
jgi:signal transduction histidine kinase